MPADTPAPPSKKMLWAGRIISAIPVLMLLLSGVMKLMKPVAVVLGFAHFGYPESLLPILGILEIACTIVYVIPLTAVLGAIFAAELVARMKMRGAPFLARLMREKWARQRETIFQEL